MEHEPKEDRLVNQERAEDEHDAGLRPQIYVASLADYNAGRLHGVWIDATQDVDEIETAVQAMLGASPEAGAEEYAIHDYEEFGCLHLNEFTDLSTVARLGKGLGEHGCAFGYWAEYVAFDREEMERFEEVYRGRWDSLEDYVRELVDDIGVMDTIEQAAPEWLQPYITIDWAMLGRDLSIDRYVHAHNGQVWVFDEC